jgi:hypothetical protein
MTAGIPPGQTFAEAEMAAHYRDPSTPAASGWLFFAGTILGLAGFMRILDAIWAFGVNEGDLPQRLQGGVLGDSLTTYAWTFLIVGLILIVASILLFMRNQLGRWVGMIAAVLATLSAMTWIPYYPVWSMVYIGIALLVLYALSKHGGREDA